MPLSTLTAVFGQANDRILLAAFEQLAEGVIVADREGRLVFVNAAATKIHGVRKLDVTPDDYTEAYDLLTADGQPHPPEELPLARAVLKGETVIDAHWKIRRPDGSVVDAIGSAKPVFGEDGGQVGAVLTLSDQTRELAARHELDAALAAKETLLYEVNHRVKNNMALVVSLLRLQSRSIEDGAARAAFADLAGRITTLGNMHRRLYETGGHDALEIVGFIAETITDSVQALSQDGDIELNIKTSGRADLNLDSAVPLVLALNELVLNSMKHAFGDTDEPVITVEIEAEPHQLTILYHDNGCGLPESPPARGKGIGRALIQNLSSQMKATVETKNSPQGYCVHLLVPLADG
jgi:PAS domain S-box-containing protein